VYGRVGHGVRPRTVSDSADRVGTLPGALLRTLVAQQASALTDQGGPQMALTIVPPAVRRERRRSSPSATVLAEGTGRVVVLRGEVDFSTAPLLADALSRVIVRRSGDVAVDLAQLEFVDTAGIRVLTACRDMLDRDGRRLTLRSPSPLVARILRVFALSDLVETQASRDAWQGAGAEPASRGNMRIQTMAAPAKGQHPNKGGPTSGMWCTLTPLNIVHPSG
jgi:anti-anti-sigma factor